MIDDIDRILGKHLQILKLVSLMESLAFMLEV